MNVKLAISSVIGTFATSNSLTEAVGFPLGGGDEVDDFCPFLRFQPTAVGLVGTSKFTPRPCNGVRCELRIHAQYYLPVGGSELEVVVG